MQNETKETIVFGGGCFWCTEAIFRHLKGVLSVMPGYAGGSKDSASYEKVSGGDTGHVEVVKIEFDNHTITLEDLLNVFFHTHNPTTPNRQGADVGEQYSSVVFYSTDDQKKTVEDFIKLLEDQKAYQERIVTKVLPLEGFYEAEDYHKAYYEKNKEVPYCELVIGPKIEKLNKQFANLVKS